jgi:hypothetical protein
MIKSKLNEVTLLISTKYQTMSLTVSIKDDYQARDRALTHQP